MSGDIPGARAAAAARLECFTERILEVVREGDALLVHARGGRATRGRAGGQVEELLARTVEAGLDAEDERGLLREVDEAWELAHRGGQAARQARAVLRRIVVENAGEAYAREERYVELILAEEAEPRRFLALRAANLAIPSAAAVPERPAPTGPVLVELAPQAAGVLLHELIGHGLECRRRGDAPLGGIGTIVGPPGLEVIDDPTREGLGGSYRIDDEGTPARPVVLVRQGRIAGLLMDRWTALGRGRVPTGHARRGDFRTAPLSRMSNLVARFEGNDEVPVYGAPSVLVTRVSSGEVSLDGRRARLRARELSAGGAPCRPTWIQVELNELRRALPGNTSGSEAVALCAREGQTVAVSTTAPALVLRASLCAS